MDQNFLYEFFYKPKVTLHHHHTIIPVYTELSARTASVVVVRNDVKVTSQSNLRWSI